MSRLSLLLLVDPDPKGLETLTYGFEREGCAVAGTSDTKMATDLVRTTSPQLVVVAIREPATPSLNLLRDLHEREATRDMPLIAIGAAGMRGAAVEAGGMDFLPTPVFVRDVITVGKMLVEVRARKPDEGEDPTVNGHLAEYGLFFIVRAMAATGRSGILQLERANRRGEMRFCDGEVTSAQVGTLQGFAAFHQLLLWEQASLELKLRTVLRRGQFPMKPDELLEEGERFLRDFAAATKDLGSAQTLLVQDVARIAATSTTVPSEVGPVVRLFDGQRTLSDAIEDSPFRIFDTLRIVTRLVEIGALTAADAPRATPAGSASSVSKPALDDWLQKSSNQPPASNQPAGRDAGAPAQGRQRTVTAAGVASLGKENRGAGGNRRKTTRRERALDRAGAAGPRAQDRAGNDTALGQAVEGAAHPVAAPPIVEAPAPPPAAAVAQAATPAPRVGVNARGEIRAKGTATPSVGNGPSVVINMGPSVVIDMGPSVIVEGADSTVLTSPVAAPPSEPARAAQQSASASTESPTLPPPPRRTITPARVIGSVATKSAAPPAVIQPAPVAPVPPPVPVQAAAASAVLVAAPVASAPPPADAGSIEIDPALLAEMQAIEAAEAQAASAPLPAASPRAAAAPPAAAVISFVSPAAPLIPTAASPVTAAAPMEAPPVAFVAQHAPPGPGPAKPQPAHAPAAASARVDPKSISSGKWDPVPTGEFRAKGRGPSSGRTRMTPSQAFNAIEADFFAREADLYKKEKVENFDDLDRKTDPNALRKRPAPAPGFHNPNARRKK